MHKPKIQSKVALNNSMININDNRKQ